MSWPPVFSRGQHWGLLVLELFLLLVMLGLFIRQSFRPQPSPNAHYARRDSVRRPVYAVEKEVVETFPFDPNTADSTALLRLGLAPWQVRAIYRYRARHGRYHEPEDFQHLPGMTPELWGRLGPMVRIAPKFRLIKPMKRPTPPPAVKDTTPRQAAVKDTLRRRSNKFTQPTKVDINTADTATLQRIPGIASYRARKIVSYRQQLGGYTRLEQVMESCELPDALLDWFSISSVPLRQLDVNHLSVRQLVRHPYISFYQARNIVEYRQQHGPFSSMEDFRQVPRFPQEKLDRLQPYLLFRQTEE